MSDITFDAIRATMPDNGNKSDEQINRALSTLPIRVVLPMSARKLGTLVSNFHDEIKTTYRAASR